MLGSMEVDQDLERTGNSLVDILAAKVVKTPVILDSGKAIQLIRECV